MSEHVSIGNLNVRVHRSDRRKTIGLTVERDGSVTANVPPTLPLGELECQLHGRELWLHSALARRASLTPPGPAKEYVSGEGFFYLGRAYRLRVLSGASGDQQIPEVRLFKGRFEIRGDCVSRGRGCFVTWYSARAESWLAERLPCLQGRVGVEALHVAVMDLGYRWASCSGTGRLNFHWRVILLPPEMVEYLVLHELCHLVEHNHTPRFWSLVKRADRESELKERWLRENGGRFTL